MRAVRKAEVLPGALALVLGAGDCFASARFFAGGDFLAVAAFLAVPDFPDLAAAPLLFVALDLLTGVLLLALDADLLMDLAALPLRVAVFALVPALGLALALLAALALFFALLAALVAVAVRVRVFAAVLPAARFAAGFLAGCLARFFAGAFFEAREAAARLLGDRLAAVPVADFAALLARGLPVLSRDFAAMCCLCSLTSPPRPGVVCAGKSKGA